MRIKKCICSDDATAREREATGKKLNTPISEPHGNS